MDILQVLILSVVEGVTEFLPISSTGHLVLTARLLNIAQTDFVKSFEVFIQLGAIMAVVWLYWRKLLASRQLSLKVLTAFLPSAVVGLIFYQVIKELLIGNVEVTLAALILGGIALIVIDYFYQENPKHLERVEALSYKQALAIGAFQTISVIPGVSRAAATIFGGLFAGLKRTAAVEFSFLLAIPTMAAATGLDLVKSSFNFNQEQLLFLGLGFLISFGVAIISIKFLLHFIKTQNFIWFGVYRILLGICFWLFIVR